MAGLAARRLVLVRAFPRPFGLQRLKAAPQRIWRRGAIVLQIVARSVKQRGKLPRLAFRLR